MMISKHSLRERERVKKRTNQRNMSDCEGDDCNISTMTRETPERRQIDGPKYGRGGEFLRTNQSGMTEHFRQQSPTNNA